MGSMLPSQAEGHGVIFLDGAIFTVETNWCRQLPTGLKRQLGKNSITFRGRTECSDLYSYLNLVLVIQLIDFISGVADSTETFTEA